MYKYKFLNNSLGWVVFLISTLVYFFTMEPTTSLWDCGEFISTAYKLQIGHPPGTPLFMLLGKIFTFFAPSPEYVAYAMNFMSVLASGFTVLFLFWSITHLARRYFGYKTSDEVNSVTKMIYIFSAGAVGALMYSFSDTAWFSAVESEVYALSSMFTALVFWCILKWEAEMETSPYATRWLVLVAYLCGLSIGIHLLNLLVIPSVVLIYYFKKHKWTGKGTFYSLVLSFVIVVVFLMLIPGVAEMGLLFERLFVNSFSLPVNSGILFYFVVLILLTSYLGYRSYQKVNKILHIASLFILLFLLGYSTNAFVLIRSSAKTSINENQPDNPYSFLFYVNREQYGNNPLLKGQNFSAPMVGYDISETYYYNVDKKSYMPTDGSVNYEYDSRFTTVLPRMWSPNPDHIKEYKFWGGIKESAKKIKLSDGQTRINPTLGNNIDYMFKFQFGWLYFRYFLWNFVGRQNDLQSHGEINHGNWLSGIDWIDSIFLGDQKTLPGYIKNDPSRNVYYFLPLLLGLLGLIAQYNRDRKNFVVVLFLFLMTGFAVAFYLNTPPLQPRERDYAFVGSFYAFSIWVGLGVLFFYEIFKNLSKVSRRVVAALVGLSALGVPLLVVSQNYDDHNRANRYFARDIALNYLNSCEKDAILFAYGDNDTFPLWYAQEVEGARTDVRIVNTSLLGMGWYADQMKLSVYDGKPVPFSLPREKYFIENDQVPVVNRIQKPLSVRDAIDYFKSTNKSTKASMQSGELSDIIPASRLFSVVNKENALKSGIITEKDLPFIQDTLWINLKDRYVGRAELMFLDLLATFDWKRPIYFTSVQDLGKFGLNEYTQLDGVAWKLIPIRTPRTEEHTFATGRVDSDKLKKRLLEDFKYGNLNGEGIFIDYYTRRTILGSRIQFAFTRLANTLSSEGRKQEAKEVVNKLLELIPLNHNEIDYSLIEIIDACYKADDKEKAKEMTEKYIGKITETLDYYGSLDDTFKRLMGSEIRQSVSLFWQTAERIRTVPGEEAFYKELMAKFSKYKKRYEYMFDSLIVDK